MNLLKKYKTETALKKDVLKFLKENYPDAWVQKISDRFSAGIPDIIACIDGRFFAFELKVRTGKYPLQEHVIVKIKKAGGNAGFCFNMKNVKKLLANVRQM